MQNQNQTAALPSKANKKTRNDILFIAVLLVLVLVAGGCLLLFRRAGDRVVVTVDGQFYGEYALDENQTVEIVTEKGRNLLVIENGKAYVSEASCPDGICAAHRPISFKGQSIICLPNKVVIEVQTENPDQPDIAV